MGEAQGKKVSPTPLRLRRSRRSRPLARSAKERPWSRRTASSEKTWLTGKVLHKRAGTPGEEKEAVAWEKDGIASDANQSNDNAPSHRVFVGRAEIGAA